MKAVSVRAIIVMLFIALLLAVLPEFLPATDGSTPRTAHAESMITPCADVIEWRCKVITGRLCPAPGQETPRDFALLAGELGESQHVLAMRRLIYTTNAIEGVNRRHRKSRVFVTASRTLR
ncbi:MAG: hypothetical protein RSD95_16485 [Clostridia bacterium]